MKPAIVVLWAVLSMPAYLGAQAPTVEMIDLGTLEQGAQSRAAAVNDLGHVVGWSSTASGQGRAFLWTAATRTMVDLGSFGGTDTFATDVNEVGHVVGKSNTPTAGHAFLWTAESGMRDLGTLGGAESVAMAISNAGHVVGYSNTTSGAYHAFLWTATGGMIDLGTLGGLHSYAYAVNDAGQVVGTSWTTASGVGHAFLWTSESGMVDLGTLDGTPQSSAVAINAAGDVVGYSSTVYESYAFVWNATTGMERLTLGGRGEATDISDNGHVVGTSQATPGVQYRAFLWTRLDGIRSLGTLIGETDPVTPGNDSRANAVNDAGHVVGQSSALINNQIEQHAFRWTADTGMTDLGTLVGQRSDATGISENGRYVIGQSRVESGLDHACVWVIGPSPDGQILADPNDGEHTENGSFINTTAPVLHVGVGSEPFGDGRNAVINFKLPDLGAVSNPFESAWLTINLESRTNVDGFDFNLDLYAFPPRPGFQLPVLGTGVYYESGADDPNTAMTLIQKDLIAGGSAAAPGRYSTNTAGSNNLVDYLNAQYAGGIGVGEYVFFRLNPDADNGAVIESFDLTSADGANPVNRPAISFTLVDSFYLPIDVRPDACPNPLSVHARGVLPVALLGGSLDLAQVDVDSLRLEGVAPLRVSPVLADIGRPFTGTITPCLVTQCASGLDGKLDVLLFFDTQAVVRALGNATTDCVLVTLTGQLANGRGSFTGRDVIALKGRRKPGQGNGK